MIINTIYTAESSFQESALPVLAGQVCFAELRPKSEIEDLQGRGYIQQPPIVIPGTVNALTAYVYSDIAKKIGARNVVIAPYYAYSRFKRMASSHRKGKVIFALVLAVNNVIQSDFFVFNKGKLEAFSSHKGFDLSIVNSVRQSEREIPIHVFQVGETPSVLGEAVIYHAEDFFAPIEKNIVERVLAKFTHVKTQRLALTPEWALSTMLKPFIIPLAISVLSFAIVPVYSFTKKLEFDFVKAQFLDVAASHESLPEQAQLNMWVARSRFIEALDKRDMTTLVMQELLQHLSVASKSLSTGSALFDRMDINLVKDTEVNGKSYNVIMEVGIPFDSRLSPEEQTARFAKALTESFGGYISGSVDVWDDVVRRQFNGKNYVFARFYLKRNDGAAHEFSN